MIPSLGVTFISIFIGCVIQIVGLFMGRHNKKFGVAVEITLAICVIAYIFYEHAFINGTIYIALISSSYFSMMTLIPRHLKYKQIYEEIQRQPVEEIELQKDTKRIMVDICVTMLVFIFAILFLLFGPETSPLKYVIAFGLMPAITELVKRFLTYKDVRMYYSHEKELFYIVSKYELRKFSIHDCKNVEVETAVDLLKLHPLLTAFMSNTDFTTGSQKVLKLTIPNETLYLTVNDPDRWKGIVEIGLADDKREEPIVILPFYHKKNIKRLVGKLYFAASIKGVSAYTGFLLLLYYLNAPSWLMIVLTIGYWFFNIYISDRVLKVAMDAKESSNLELNALAQRIFKKAGIPNVRIYETESSQYNGLATGMNIGRAMVTLTTATLKLPMEVIEGILAHEAVHVKKRDVMWGQLWRLCFIVVVLFIILLIREMIHDLEAYKIPLFFLVWLLMIMFPIYQSFVSQWMEVRADHLGATLLEGGNEQMANSLRLLTIAQDDELQKSLTHSMAEESNSEKSSLERESWLWRVIEFQFMPHPPMYWRVQALRSNQTGWGRTILKQWTIDRLKESISK